MVPGVKCLCVLYLGASELDVCVSVREFSRFTRTANLARWGMSLSVPDQIFDPCSAPRVAPSVHPLRASKS